MKKVQKEKDTNYIFLLFSPEDSSCWDDDRIRIASCGLGRMRKIHSILKLLLWYIIAIAMGIFLSSFH